MDPVLASALTAAAGTVVGVVGTVALAIVGFPRSRSANRETIAAAKATTDETIAAARGSSKATIEAAHADVQRTLDNTRGGQIADLYSRAIEQLGSDKLDVRIGGIYALERVARDSAADHPTVMEVLRSFIREHSRELQTSTDPGSLARERSKRADVNAALTVIERRDIKRSIRSINLADAGLTTANLPSAILPRADLTGANLGAPGEELRVTLRDANLSDAKLADAHLMKVDLTGAILVGANLRRVDFSGAKLVGAILADADLQDADLTRADLRGAALTRADLRGADLSGALWAEDVAAPEGWVRDAGSGRLSRSNATASSLLHYGAGVARIVELVWQTTSDQRKLTGQNHGAAVARSAQRSPSAAAGAEEPSRSPRPGLGRGHHHRLAAHPGHRPPRLTSPNSLRRARKGAPGALERPAPGLPAVHCHAPTNKISAQNAASKPARASLQPHE